MVEIRGVCSFEADKLVESIADYVNMRDKRTKEIASSRAIDLIICITKK